SSSARDSSSDAAARTASSSSRNSSRCPEGRSEQGRSAKLRRATVLPANRLPAFATLALGLMVAAIAVVAYVAPIDADQGFSQKIFYFHVPVALTAYAMFGWGAWKALRHLWKRERGADLESYVAIHLGVIFGAMTLLTGSIWAKISWGRWWIWSSDQLVLFLVLFLFY